MKQTTIHNPDRYMSDLRQILSQGKKRIGLLVGAGGPMSVRVNANGVMDDDGEPLIPDVARLTQCVLDELEPLDFVENSIFTRFSGFHFSILSSSCKRPC